MKKTDVFMSMIILLCAMCSAQFSEAKHENATDLLNFEEVFVASALARTRKEIQYDGRYIKLQYPNGDVPDNIGVCTDLLIRSYRRIDIDLQKLVHEDMLKNFELYPKKWGLKRPDKNIDHRRVPNLRTFFARFGQEFPLSTHGSAYKTGDLVTWMLPGNLPHIGIVSSTHSEDGLRPLILHNVGSGPELSDFLFSHPVTGHYRYFPSQQEDTEINQTQVTSNIK